MRNKHIIGARTDEQTYKELETIGRILGYTDENTGQSQSLRFAIHTTVELLKICMDESEKKGEDFVIEQNIAGKGRQTFIDKAKQDPIETQHLMANLKAALGDERIQGLIQGHKQRTETDIKNLELLKKAIGNLQVGGNHKDNKFTQRELMVAVKRLPHGTYGGYGDRFANDLIQKAVEIGMLELDQSKIEETYTLKTPLQTIN